jgi:multidrug resistance efflux pump
MKTTGTTSRRGRLYLRILPVLVWLGAAACVVVLFRQRSQRFEVLGIAQGKVHQIAATCDGRLESVPVQLFDRVSRGDTVAIINTVPDDENLGAELAVVSAEIQHLTAELTPTQDRLLAEATERETDKIAAQRRFNVDVENTKLRILELKVELETDRKILEDLELDIKSFIIQDRLQTDDAALYELQKLKVRRDTLAKKIEESKHLLTQAEQDLKQAEQRSDEFAQRQPQHPSVDGALEVIHKAIEVQEQRMKELMARRNALVLKSSIDGMVSQILNRQGEAVLAGEPILSITELKPSEIIAYADENQARQIQEGTAVELVKTSEPAQIAKSEVTYLGPDISQMPVRLWRNPNIAQWGRPILIKIPPGLRLIPGETVGVRGL